MGHPEKEAHHHAHFCKAYRGRPYLLIAQKDKIFKLDHIGADLSHGTWAKGTFQFNILYWYSMGEKNKPIPHGVFSHSEHTDTYYEKAFTAYDFGEDSKDVKPEFDFNINKNELVWAFMSSNTMGKVRINGPTGGEVNFLDL